MEDKQYREGFGDAKQHFEGYLNSIKSKPKEDRDLAYWVWVFQFGSELEEAEERELLSKEEVKGIKKEVADFMDEGTNLQDFLEAKETFDGGRAEKRKDYKLWWQDED